MGTTNTRVTATPLNQDQRELLIGNLEETGYILDQRVMIRCSELMQRQLTPLKNYDLGSIVRLNEKGYGKDRYAVYVTVEEGIPSIEEEATRLKEVIRSYLMTVR